MENEQSPIIIWYRRDLRLSDHPALNAAVQSGRSVIPVYILDNLAQRLGAAPKWRLSLGLEALQQRLTQVGSRLILRQGNAIEVLQQLVRETGASAVYWTRAYDPDSIERDSSIKTTLKDQGVEAKSFSGHLLFEPWTVATKSGQPFRVFTPMWRAVQHRDVDPPVPTPNRLIAPPAWPKSDDVGSWAMGAAMNRGAGVVAQHVRAGEEAAFDVLEAFVGRVSDYSNDRDRLDYNGTSALAEYLSLGEISPRSIWHRVRISGMNGVSGTGAYLRQLVWREFAYHLMFHTPHLLGANWKPEWDAFPWRFDEDNPQVIAWKTARTGIPVVDAGLREMYVTGRMHNRARMIVASYLTKHLMTHWKVGLGWFEECLVDWDPASNAMGWQWVAGSGPDASPFFRIFNPVTQQEKFDPSSAYVRKWVAEGQTAPPHTALAYFEAIPRAWGLEPTDNYPAPIVTLSEGRAQALAAYEHRKTQ
ncbi:DNA photolyase PhrA [Ruegeria sp. HU-ET01832]|uniref:cryptochrome/photolyase family protein n=1 Tax=Ruegeria sp. HU-ET01832 TaxID=3135906 RepID=UPI00310A454A